MPFGLKNAGDTYQWMVTHMFQELISKTVEVYIDDMVVKTKEEGTHARDLQSVFDILKQHKLRLNAKKCAFGGIGQILGIHDYYSRYRSKPRPDNSHPAAVLSRKPEGNTKTHGHDCHAGEVCVKISG